MQLGLIVTDASPLITLAAGEALDCLTAPGLPVVIPDMVYYEVTRDLARTGAEDIVAWARRRPGQVMIAPTSVFAEFQVLSLANPAARSKGRGELSALEILNAAVADEPELQAVLIFEDNDLQKRSFVRLLPERVIALSTGDLLRELEQAGRIQSSDRILDLAAGKERNIAAQREAGGNDVARAAFRRHLDRARNAGD